MRILITAGKIGSNILLVSLALVAALAGASAQSVSESYGTRIGFLKCTVSTNSGIDFGSSRALNCVLSASGGQIIEDYAGRIVTYGDDIGYRGYGVIIWGVFASSTDRPPSGALSGLFDGIASNQALARGFGGRILVGGPQGSLALQPFAIDGVEGINIAAGITSLRLELANVQRG